MGVGVGVGVGARARARVRVSGQDQGQGQGGGQPHLHAMVGGVRNEDLAATRRDARRSVELAACRAGATVGAAVAQHWRGVKDDDAAWLG